MTKTTEQQADKHWWIKKIKKDSEWELFEVSDLNIHIINDPTYYGYMAVPVKNPSQLEKLYEERDQIARSGQDEMWKKVLDEKIPEAVRIARKEERERIVSIVRKVHPIVSGEYRDEIEKYGIEQMREVILTALTTPLEDKKDV